MFGIKAKAKERISRVEPVISAPAKPAMKVPRYVLDSLQSVQKTAFKITDPLPGIAPENATVAMDDAFGSIYAFAAQNSLGGEIGWPGFPVLSELAQRPEYRHISETIAEEMTRKWIEFETAGDDDKSEKVKLIEQEFERLKVRECFKKAAVHDGFFGRGHIYVEVNSKDDELLNTPLIVSKHTVPIGSLKRLQNVEPIWSYPNQYNSNDPTDKSFYRPNSWFVQGKPYHRTRLLTFVGREVPDILKPAYGFAGLSLSQMAIPYVENWLRTRQSVSDMLHSFSIMALATDLSSVLADGGADGLLNRVQLFNQARDNRGLMIFNKDSEDLKNVSAPLGTLDKLQAQAQEQMCSVTKIPLVKFAGLTPTGLNASSDGEIRVFYDTISAWQAAFFRPNLQTIFELAQLNIFGEIDPEISFKFLPLWQLDDAGEAAVRKTESDTDIQYIESGVLSPLDVRKRLANKPGSDYSNLDVDDLPDPPEGGGGSELNDPETNKVDEHGEAGATSGV